MNFTFFRKPLKLILYAIVFCLLSTIALTFILQYYLDGIAIDEAISKYAYVATVYNRNYDDGLIQPLPTEVVKEISESQYVYNTNSSKVYAAKSDNIIHGLDAMITQETLDTFCMVEGHLMGGSSVEFYKGAEKFTIEIDKKWAGSEFIKDYLQIIMHRQNKSHERFFNEGDHVFLLCWISRDGYAYFDGDGEPQTYFEPSRAYLFAPRDADKGCFDPQRINSPIIQNDYLIIPKELNEDESNKYIEEWLKENDLYKYVDITQQCNNMLTVKTVTDMSLLLKAANNQLFIIKGRELDNSDIGKNVCVIDEYVAQWNDLDIGDTIELSLADGAYKAKAMFFDNEWESGYPDYDDELLDYSEPEKYEIVGITQLMHTDLYRQVLSLTRNDVLIPPKEGNYSYENVKPCNFSFKILGPDYDNFINTYEENFLDEGYQFEIVDLGWEDVEDVFYSLKNRRIISLMCSITSFILAIVLFVVLLWKQFNYEFGLRKLLGATSLEAQEIYITSYLSLTIPSAMISVIVSAIVYDNWLLERMAEIIEGNVPSMIQCTGILIIFISIEVIVGFVLLIILSFLAQRKSILRLIK